MEQAKTRLIYAALIAAPLWFLAGCGGDGSGGIAVVTGVTPATVSGVASKGLVKQAKVLVCRIINGVPEADATCTSGTTDANGAYSITMADGYSGSAMVKVMPSPTGNSMMVDETTGKDIPYTMTMRAAIATVSSSTTAYVTPFSEMAASAVSTTTIDATKIKQAIDAVQSTMANLGIDLSVMPMLNVKDSAGDANALAAQSNMVRQLSRIAAAAANSTQIVDANGVPCSQAADPSTRIACVVSAMSGVMSSYLTADSAKAASLMQALLGSTTTNVMIPVMASTGALTMQLANMTDLTSLQSLMQNAGLTTNAAANVANVMIGKMH